MVSTIRDKLRSDRKVRRSAESDGEQIFQNNVFPKIFDAVAQALYVEQTEAYTKLFENQALYNAVCTSLAQELYRELSNRQESD